MDLSPGGMRRFHLDRTQDATGVSGTGRIAEGVQFHDGQCALKWLTSVNSVAIYPDIYAVNTIHGHDGQTHIVWDDKEKE